MSIFPSQGLEIWPLLTVRNDDIPDGKLGLSFHPEKSGLELESKNTLNFYVNYLLRSFVLEPSCCMDLNHEFARMQHQRAGATRKNGLFFTICFI
jgi:hypothetical protein